MSRRDQYLEMRATGVPADLVWSKVAGVPLPARHEEDRQAGRARVMRSALGFGRSLGLEGPELIQFAFEVIHERLGEG